MKVENQNVLCRRIIRCGQNLYHKEIVVVLFMHGEEELIWQTTSDSKLISLLDEGQKYTLSWHQNGDTMSYVKA